jgi:hypothetical protein
MSVDPADLDLLDEQADMEQDLLDDARDSEWEEGTPW